MHVKAGHKCQSLPISATLSLECLVCPQTGCAHTEHRCPARHGRWCRSAWRRHLSASPHSDRPGQEEENVCKKSFLHSTIKCILSLIQPLLLSCAQYLGTHTLLIFTSPLGNLKHLSINENIHLYLSIWSIHWHVLVRSARVRSFWCPSWGWPGSGEGAAVGLGVRLWWDGFSWDGTTCGKLWRRQVVRRWRWRRQHARCHGCCH